MITDRLILRRWADADRGPFAQLNADAQVMRYFRDVLDRAASDALVDRIERSFDEFGYGLWAIEVRSTGRFIGFTGLALQTFDAPFTPAVEVGWRLARSAWHQGYATEAGAAAVRFAFGPAGLHSIVSLTSTINEPSRAVMRRLAMTHDAKDDFEHPLLPPGHPLRPHVLYRLTKQQWTASAHDLSPDERRN